MDGFGARCGHSAARVAAPRLSSTLHFAQAQSNGALGGRKKDSPDAVRLAFSRESLKNRLRSGVASGSARLGRPPWNGTPSIARPKSVERSNTPVPSKSPPLGVPRPVLPFDLGDDLHSR